MKSIARSFVRNGHRYYVPTIDVEDWVNLATRIFDRWVPHAAFHTFKPTAHIGAVRPHLGNFNFALIDIKDFFDHVTRAKVSRALASIGFAHWECFRIAGQSTVGANGRYTIPRGFRQSNLLAALVLDRSIFGSFVHQGKFKSKVTIYCDDIILSSFDEDRLREDFNLAIMALERAHFPVNLAKTQQPSNSITAFNIEIGHGKLKFTSERMSRFADLARTIIENPNLSLVGKINVYEKACGRYMRSVNHEQEGQIRRHLMLTR